MQNRDPNYWSQLALAMSRKKRRVFGLSTDEAGLPSAEDLAQEAFLKFWRKFQSIPFAIEEGRKYLFKTVATCLIDALEARDRERTILAGDEAFTSFPAPVTKRSDLWKWGVLAQFRPDLPDKVRIPLTYFVLMEDFSPEAKKEICRIIEITPEALRQSICRLRKSLEEEPSRWESIEDAACVEPEFVPPYLLKRMDENAPAVALYCLREGRAMDTAELARCLADQFTYINFICRATTTEIKCDDRATILTFFAKVHAAIAYTAVDLVGLPLLPVLSPLDFLCIGWLQIGILSAEKAVHLFAALGDQENMADAVAVVAKLRQLAGGHCLERTSWI